jgi:hypothetical protein
VVEQIPQLGTLCIWCLASQVRDGCGLGIQVWMCFIMLALDFTSKANAIDVGIK